MAYTMPGAADIMRDMLKNELMFTYNYREEPVMPESNPKAAAAAAAGKLRLELIESAMTHPVARVMAHGADKYGVRNWRTNPIYARTYIGAMRRHIDEWEDGIDADHDSGEHPLAHVASDVQVVLDALKHGTLVDDRDFAESKPAGDAANQQGGAKTQVAHHIEPLDFDHPYFAQQGGRNDVGTAAAHEFCGIEPVGSHNQPSIPATERDMNLPKTPYNGGAWYSRKHRRSA